MDINESFISRYKSTMDNGQSPRILCVSPNKRNRNNHHINLEPQVRFFSQALFTNAYSRHAKNDKIIIRSQD